jgi:hypothetical protein
MLRILALTFMGLTLAAPSQAQPPAAAVASPSTRLLPFSGTALDAAGAPVKGSATVTFELYEEQNGSSSLWQETQRVQTDGQGRYLAYLGSVNPLPQSAFGEERARWLGVTIQGRAEPRVMLAAVPYALRAADADTLGGQPAADFVRARADGRLETSAGVIAEAAVDGSGVPGQLAKFSSSTTLSSSVISESGSNRIGVGLPDPTGGGVVDSVFTIKNLDNNTGFAVLNESQARRFALNTLATGAWTLYDGGNSTWNQGLTQINGNVGIGVTAPTARLEVLQTGVGFAPPAGSFKVNNTGSVAPAVQGQVNSIYGNNTASAIYGIATGTGGYAGYFDSTNTTNTNYSVFINYAGTGTGMQVNHSGASGNIAVFSSGGNVARIDKTGKGFFNGGTQVGGADLAESFEVDAGITSYEPGDVLEISTTHDRRLRKAAQPYSTRVVGVYATKPGVMLTDQAIDTDGSQRVPLGVVGVIPTKVSAENGAIHRGDLLVAARTAGHAMKSHRNPPVGSVIGKALAEFSGPGTGLIDVFVNVR